MSSREEDVVVVRALLDRGPGNRAAALQPSTKMGPSSSRQTLGRTYKSCLIRSPLTSQVDVQTNQVTDVFLHPFSLPAFPLQSLTCI